MATGNGYIQGQGQAGRLWITRRGTASRLAASRDHFGPSRNTKTNNGRRYLVRLLLLLLYEQVQDAGCFYVGMPDNRRDSPLSAVTGRNPTMSPFARQGIGLPLRLPPRCVCLPLSRKRKKSLDGQQFWNLFLRHIEGRGVPGTIRTTTLSSTG